MEDEIKNLPFNVVNIFQPGHLAGRINWQRKKNDPRLDVFAFEIASLFIDPLMINGLRKYRSIKAEELAKFIVKRTNEGTKGTYIFDYNDIIIK